MSLALKPARPYVALLPCGVPCTQDHCLWDLLIRFKNGELSNCELPVIVSNHPDLKHVADMFGVPFRCLPIVDKSEFCKERPRQGMAVYSHP